jgi:tetratricopeptide (TPR) repeat protein
LEELYGATAQTHAAELSHHFFEAELVLGPAKLAQYSLLAGEQALASSAYEDALIHFERGLIARDIALSGTEIASDEEVADLLFGLARAQTATFVGHQLMEAFTALSRAFEYYAESGSVAQAVAAAEFPINSPAYRIPGVAEVIARALALVPSDSHEAGRLLSRYGGVLGASEGDYDGAQQALRRAMEIASREGDVALEVRTLSYAAIVSGQHIHWQEGADNGLRAIELATADESPFSDLTSRFWTAVGPISLGNIDAARPHVMVMRDLADRRSTPRLLATNHLLVVTTLSCLEGDWKSGREFSDRGLEMSPLHPQHLGTRVGLEFETGENTEAEVYLQRLIKAMRRNETDPRLLFRTSMAIAAIARVTGISDRLEMAHTAAEAVLSQ